MSRSRSPALRFGGALHEGLAAWYRGLGAEASLDAIARAWDNTWDSDDYRTLEKCAKTFIAYIKEYPHENFTVVGAPETPIVEQTFAIDTGWFCGCLDCGKFNLDPTKAQCDFCHADLEPIEYGGILDLLIDFNGVVYPMDHKSTSIVAPVKGGYFFDQFKPDNQMTGYHWGGTKLSGGRVGGVMINAIAMNKSDTVFARRITSRNELDVQEWLVSLRLHCTEIMRHKSLGVFPLRTTSCTTKYGKCQFHSVHTLSNADDRLRRLETDYIHNPWDFENRDTLPTEGASE